MKRILFVLIILLVLFASCKKDWLDAKSDKALVVPSTLTDYQALLDNTSDIFNQWYPDLGEIGADDYYVSYEDWLNLYTLKEVNAYVWAKDVYEGEDVTDWSSPYQRIFYENVVLDGLKDVEANAGNMDTYNNIKGTALFCRAFDFYSLAQEFAPPYSAANAGKDPGLPLRLSSDINEVSVRSTVQETYGQIIADLENALKLLPPNALYKTRPCKAAACALLARTYLTMQDYEKAKAYADSSLAFNSALMDFNMLDSTASVPVPQFNEEVLYHFTFPYHQITRPTVARVDTILYAQYDENDLRRIIFFKNDAGVIRYKGSYNHSVIRFAGLATDEVYLTRAECYARAGNVTDALKDLNQLLGTRYRSGRFVPVTATDAAEALQKILQERRKELIYRGTRWTDLRRLNLEGYNITLTRMLNGETYRLPPNDVRYTYPLPEQEVKISGLEQNPR